MIINYDWLIMYVGLKLLIKAQNWDGKYLKRIKTPKMAIKTSLKSKLRNLHWSSKKTTKNLQTANISYKKLKKNFCVYGSKKAAKTHEKKLKIYEWIFFSH